jgi:hypothetical protein
MNGAEPGNTEGAAQAAAPEGSRSGTLFAFVFRPLIHPFPGTDTLKDNIKDLQFSTLYDLNQVILYLLPMGLC